MQKTRSDKSKIQVEVLIREGCTYSDRVLKKLTLICQQYPMASLLIHNNEDPEACRKSFAGITPSIWVNGKLWYMGSFNADRFETKLQSLLEDPPVHLLF